MERHLGRVWAALFALNAVVSASIGLPLLAVGTVGSTPVPGDQPVVGDSVGWPAYVRQITAVYDALPDRDHAAVFTSNYGEAGAVHHYAPDVPVFSAQNALYDQARPPDSVTTLVVVGGQYPERPRAVRPLHGPRPARQRGRRRQRGAGAADRGLHRPRRRLGRALAAAAPPRLRRPRRIASVGS